MTLKEKFTALRKLFSDKRHWIKYTFHRQASHSPTNRECYCLGGGLNKVAGRPQGTDFITDAEIKALGFNSHHEMFNWNDNPDRTIGEVRTRIDEALAQLNKRNKKFSV